MNELSKMSIARWAEKHEVPPLMAVQAWELVAMADGAFLIVEGFRTGKLDQQLPARTSLSQWLGLYRDHRRVFRVLADHTPDTLGFGSGDDLEAAWDAANALAKNVPGVRDKVENKLRSISEEQWREAISEGMEAMRQWQGECLNEAKICLQGGYDDEDDGADFYSLLGDVPELHFFMRVTFPCFVAYETFPLHLLRRARGGDISAIERIVRLDAMTIHDPRIAAWVHGGTGSTQRAREDDAARWMREGLSQPLACRQVKYAFAGLISWLSERLWRRLTPCEIRELFDAATEDRVGTAGVQDPDMPTTPESFQKAIQRYRKLWEAGSALWVDKKRPA